MKPEIAHVVLADNVILEEGTNYVTIVNERPGFVIPDGKTEIDVPRIVILAKIVNAKGANNAELRVIDPAGGVFLRTDLSGDGPAPSNVLNLRAIFNRIVFKDVGIYRVEVFLDGKKLPSMSFHSFKIAKK